MPDATTIEHPTPRVDVAVAFDAMVQEQVHALTEGLTCWRTVYDIPTGEKPTTMLVRNAHMGIGQGKGKGNVGVVRVVPFQQGWDGVKAGSVVWVASCR